MLQVDQLRAGYGSGMVLHEVSLDALPHTVHAVVGHNGAGKTTLLHAVAGLLRPRGGRILLAGRDITALPAHRRARAGVALVPQGRRVFASLTVAEHLAIAYRRRRKAARDAGSGWDRARVLDLLPQLGQRLRHRGAQLSGGEQQMLAIARALLTQPRLLLLDEPTEGLAPALVAQVSDLIRQLAAASRQSGSELTVLLAAPGPDLAAAVADRVTILTTGRATTADVAPDLAQLQVALAPAAGHQLPSGPADPPG